LRIASGYDINPWRSDSLLTSQYKKQLSEYPTSYTVSIISATSISGMFVDIPVTLSSFAQTAGGTFQINYNPHLMSVDNIVLGAVPSSNIWSEKHFEETAGVLRIALAGRSNLESGQGELFKVRFKTIGGLPTQNSSIYLVEA